MEEIKALEEMKVLEETIKALVEIIKDLEEITKVLVEIKDLDKVVMEAIKDLVIKEDSVVMKALVKVVLEEIKDKEAFIIREIILTLILTRELLIFMVLTIISHQTFNLQTSKNLNNSLPLMT